jgi:arylamine N-acetyltransferase
MSADPQVIRSYLAHLGAEPAPPSLEALSDLVRRHMLRIPFENVGLILGLRQS